MQIDMGSLIVREGSGGLKPLTDRDRREIAVTARKTLGADRHPEATFTAESFKPGADDGGTITGTLTLAGATRPLWLQVSQDRAGPATTPPRKWCSLSSESSRTPVSSARCGCATRSTSTSTSTCPTGRRHQAGSRRDPGPPPGTRPSGCSSCAPRRSATSPTQAGAVASACHAMAVRFHRGGKLMVFGTGGSSTDAQHVAVEFVHPVIVGKRALPAISLTTDVATVTGVAAREGMAAIFAHQIRYLAEPADIALGICADGNCPSVLAGLETARARPADHSPGGRGRRRDRGLPGRRPPVAGQVG